MQPNSNLPDLRTILACAATVCFVALLSTNALAQSETFEGKVQRVLRVDPNGAGPQETDDAHPLLPALRYAYVTYAGIEQNVRDYTCTVVRRERIRGKLREREYMTAKVRHQQTEGDKVLKPLGVYIKYMAPTDLKDRELLYVAGENDGRLIATRGGNGALKGLTVKIDPFGPRARESSRYPITDFGFQRLGQRLIEFGIEEMQSGFPAKEFEVKYFYKAKINGRSTTMIQVKHLENRPEYKYHIARIFVDDELAVPIRFASYLWPDKEGDPPKLAEEYTYVDVKLNVGLADADFDRSNPHYGFREPSEPSQDESENFVNSAP